MNYFVASFSILSIGIVLKSTCEYAQVKFLQNPSLDGQFPTGPGSVMSVPLRNFTDNPNPLLCARACSKESNCTLYSFDQATKTCFLHTGHYSEVELTTVPKDPSSIHERQSRSVLLAVGGYPEIYLDAFSILYPGMNHWEDQAPVATKRHWYALVTHEPSGKVYAVGGISVWNGPNLPVEVWSPDTNKFRQIANGFSPLGTHMNPAVGIFEEKMFVCGGKGAAKQKCEVLDLQTETWGTGPDPPFKGEVSAFATVGDFLYVAKTTKLWEDKRAYRLNMRTEVWENLTNPLLDTMSNGAGAEYKGQFVICGGNTHGWAFQTSCEVYDASSDQWKSFPSLVGPRDGHQMIEWEGNLYVFGGFAGGNNPRLFAPPEMFEMFDGIKWSQLPNSFDFNQTHLVHERRFMGVAKTWMYYVHFKH